MADAHGELLGRLVRAASDASDTSSMSSSAPVLGAQSGPALVSIDGQPADPVNPTAANAPTPLEASPAVGAASPVDAGVRRERSASAKWASMASGSGTILLSMQQSQLGRGRTNSLMMAPALGDAGVGPAPTT